MLCQEVTGRDRGISVKASKFLSNRRQTSCSSPAVRRGERPQLTIMKTIPCCMQNLHGFVCNCKSRKRNESIEKQVDELAVLVRKLAHSLKKCNETSDLPDRAMDYLKRSNLTGSPLRDRTNQLHDRKRGLYGIPDYGK